MERPKDKILVVDDERSMRELLSIFLETEGYQVDVADGGKSGLDAIKKEIYDLIITDLKMPKVSGIDILKAAKEISPDTGVIIITAFGTMESAIEAMKLGASDYIQKPFKMDEMRIVVVNALERHKLRKEVALLRGEVKKRYSLENIIGKSPQMQNIFSAIPKIAASNAIVLIMGESGSGKEVVARAIHNLSDRKDKPFVAINCAAIPEGLLESELFGHMRGSFTGAVSNKQGLFELASGGTLFLDEIADMPQGLQPKLLRVIEDGVMRRVGGISDIKTDVRIISATNRNIKTAVSDGSFREDLFYRLNVIPLTIPPLRERKEDIPLLIEHFLRKLNTNKTITGRAMDILMDYPWWGNVRELENTVERMVVMSDSENIDIDDIPDEIKIPRILAIPTDIPQEGVDIDRIIEDIEKRYLANALEKAGGVKTEAARLLRISFRSFRHRLSKYKMQ